MPWNFADNAGNSFAQGFNAAREAKALKDKEAQTAISDRLKTGIDGTKAALDLADKIENPEIKAQLYTKAVNPMIKLLTGYDPGTITGEMLQDPHTKAAVDAAHDLTSTYLNQMPDPATKKPMSLNEYKLKLGMLMSATKSAREQLGPAKDLLESTMQSVKQNIPGPGNTDTTGTVDPIQGTVTPLTNTATGQPTTTGPKPPASQTDPAVMQAKVEQSIKSDEKSLQALVNPAKGKTGLPDLAGNLLRRISGKAPSWSDFSQSEQTQLAAAQSLLQRMQANLTSANKLRTDQGLDPIEPSPAVADLAGKFAKIKGVPGSNGTDPNAEAVAYLAKNHPELKNPTPADIAWAQGKLKK